MGHEEAVFKVGSVGVRWLFASKCGIASEAVIRVQVGYEAGRKAINTTVQYYCSLVTLIFVVPTHLQVFGAPPLVRQEETMP